MTASRSPAEHGGVNYRTRPRRPRWPWPSRGIDNPEPAFGPELVSRSRIPSTPRTSPRRTTTASAPRPASGGAATTTAATTTTPATKPLPPGKPGKTTRRATHDDLADAVHRDDAGGPAERRRGPCQRKREMVPVGASFPSDAPLFKLNALRQKAPAIRISVVGGSFVERREDDPAAHGQDAHVRERVRRQPLRDQARPAHHGRPVRTGAASTPAGSRPRPRRPRPRRAAEHGHLRL